ncbi:MAG TPA: hypothetical protein VGC70_02470 [Burkholderiales bacterium]|jgi:Flp pilus assembly protein TadB
MRIDINERPLLMGPRAGRNWAQRALWTLAGASVLVLAFLFITVALIAGSLLAIGIALRWWWIVRRLRAAHKAAAPLEAEYTVVPHDENRKIIP